MTSLPQEEIARLCQQHHVRELALFGSRHRGTANNDSDYDFLVTFEVGAHVGLFEYYDLKTKLEMLLGRDVDLVCKDAIRNPYRKQSMLESYQVLYVA